MSFEFYTGISVFMKLYFLQFMYSTCWHVLSDCDFMFPSRLTYDYKKREEKMGMRAIK